MELENAKKELVRRYKYLYENAYFILAPYMYEQTEEEFKKITDEYLEKYGNRILKEPLIYLRINKLDSINSLFEEFLLSNRPLEESSLYQMVESKRTNNDYLDKVKNGLNLIEKANRGKKRDELLACYFEEKLSIWEILCKVSDYIEEQSGDLYNKERKLYVLDQYFRIARYKNNGKIYTSGRKLNLHDVSSMVLDLRERVPLRDKKDIGITNNSFISIISTAPYYEDNFSIFTENEKQQIYLEYHDELPYDLEITCGIEEEYVETMIDTRLCRPDNTLACGENFVIKEEEIFVDPSDKIYRYYQLCPNCGYMVNIPKEILSEGIKKRIEDRCSKDDKLFRKMFLYSELFSLDRKSCVGQKKVLKK